MNKQEQQTLMQKCRDEAAQKLTGGNYTPDFILLEKIVDLAMQKYAKAVSIGFAKWLQGKYYPNDLVANSWHDFNGDNWYTTEELFKQYTEQ